MKLYLKTLMKRNCKSLNLFIILFVLLVNLNAFADEGLSGMSPEYYLNDLLQDSETLSDVQLHENYVAAAEIKQATGDLSGAAELFKKASFAVYGKKDFLSLYRSAVLNVEMALYKEAEADLRAVLMFSDEPELRIKATLLTARLKSAQGDIEEAQAILINIFQLENIPAEAAVWAAGFYEKNKNTYNLSELGMLLKNNEINNSNILAELAPLITPEIVFGNGGSSKIDDIKTEDKNPETIIEDAEQSAAVQLGSFSKKENAEDLVSSVTESGIDAVIKTKTVNGKNYYAVIVPLDESRNLQSLIIELKEKGYEGYPVY